MSDQAKDVWTERIKALGILVAALAGLVGAIGTVLNHNRLATVEERQVVNESKLDVAGEKLDAAVTVASQTKAKTEESAAKADRKLANIENVVKTLAEQ